MSDRTDRSERLRRRFDRGEGTVESETVDAEVNESADPDASTAEPTAASTGGSTADAGVADRGSVKERPSTLMYLPESIDRDLDLTFDEVNLTYRRVYNEKLEKNRDYYPLVALYGIDTLREWDADEIREALDRLRDGATE